MDKFGANALQVRAYLATVPRIAEFGDSLGEAVRSEDRYRDATTEVIRAPRSASLASAIDSAVRRVIADEILPALGPRPAPGRGLTRNKLLSNLQTSVDALALRPKVGDELVARVVDPFCDAIGFEWKSWGVNEHGKVAEAPEWAIALLNERQMQDND